MLRLLLKTHRHIQPNGKIHLVRLVMCHVGVRFDFELREHFSINDYCGDRPRSTLVSYAHSILPVEMSCSMLSACRESSLRMCVTTAK